MGQGHGRFERGQQGAHTGALVVDHQAGQVAEYIQLAQQHALKQVGRATVEKHEAEKVAIYAHRQGVTGAVAGIQQGFDVKFLAVLQHAEVVDDARRLAGGDALQPSGFVQASVIQRQGVGLILHGDKGFHPVTAVVVEGHSQALYFRVFVLQGLQQVTELELQRALLLQVMQVRHPVSPLADRR